MNAEPIACSLSATDYAERLDQIERLGRGTLVRAETHSGGAEIVLHDDAATRAALGDIIRAESRCCAFLAFRTTRAGGELRLTIDGPREADLIVGDLVRRLTVGASR